MKIYEGRRVGYTPLVTVNGSPLNPRLDLYNHSPSGFEWGYCGSGPAQLALGLWTDHLNDDQQAFNLYQRFKWAVVTELPKKNWTFTSRDLEQALGRIRIEENGHERRAMKFAVKRYWQLGDEVEVEAHSVDEAIEIAHARPLDESRGEFVMGSLNSDPHADVQPLIEKDAPCVR